jgi:transcriptional regulator with XRE-family HTH domain
VPTTTPEGEVFGRTLRRLRQERELTQERFAASANLTTGFVNSMELGYKIPSLTTILKVAHALGVTPSELLGDFTAPAVRRLLS